MELVHAPEVIESKTSVLGQPSSNEKQSGVLDYQVPD
jgi:hypothetical protein